MESDFDLGFQSQSADSKIVASLERISQAFRVLLWQESKEYALTPIQVQVLIFLHFHSEEKCKVSYLAAEFNMTKATISDTVKTLEQKGLIEKVSEPEDTRSYRMYLTEKGRSIAQKTAMFSKAIYNPIAQIPEAEKEKLLLHLLGVIRHLQQAGIITIQRMCFSCKFYRYTDSNQVHYCKLLNQVLEPVSLRVDCPEHQPSDV
jgi:DNA-binding MarR family transcriptional regulator